MADDEQDEPERWRLDHDDRSHVLTIASAGVFARQFRWTIDGEEVAEKRTTDDRFTLSVDDRPLALAVRMSQFADSARRVQLFTGEDPAIVQAAATTGIGGTDLQPSAGSRAARRQERMAENPTLYTAQRTLGAVAAIVIPIAGIWLLTQLLGLIPWPDVDLPDIPWPSIDLPDLPDVPLPDINLPSIDLPEAPGWLKQLAEAAKYVAPVVIAFVVARGEIRRKKRVDERRDDMTGAPGDAPADDPR